MPDESLRIETKPDIILSGSNKKSVMTIQELDIKKNDLLKQVEKLVKIKKVLYSDVDIESPIGSEEKELNQKIAYLFGEINNLVIEKRKIIKGN